MVLYNVTQEPVAKAAGPASEVLTGGSSCLGPQSQVPLTPSILPARASALFYVVSA